MRPSAKSSTFPGCLLDVANDVAALGFGYISSRDLNGILEPGGNSIMRDPGFQVKSFPGTYRMPRVALVRRGARFDTNRSDDAGCGCPSFCMKKSVSPLIEPLVQNGRSRFAPARQYEEINESKNPKTIFHIPSVSRISYSCKASVASVPTGHISTPLFNRVSAGTCRKNNSSWRVSQ